MGKPKFDLSGQERMARMVCKELLDRPGLPRLELVRLMSVAVSKNRRRHRKGQRLLEKEDFEPALQLAASRKWLVEGAGVFRWTAEGEAVAKHSRTSPGRLLKRLQAL